MKHGLSEIDSNPIRSLENAARGKKPMPETKKQNQIIVKPEFNEFVQAVDEYTAQLPLVIRESIRQVLYCEYEEKYEEMEKLCRDILEKNPGNTEALALLGRAQLSQRKYEEAEQTFRGILDKEPDRNYERIEHGITFHALGRYRDALSELQNADPQADYHPFYFTALADSYQKTGNRQKARDAFRAEITRWEETGEMPSQDNLDVCYNNLIYLDAALYLGELSADLNSYERFLEKAEMTPEMKEHLAGNIAYWSTLLTVPTFRTMFVKFVRDVEQAGYLVDSPRYSIIDSAYRAEESYRYHEDKNIDAFMESFLSAESAENGENDSKAALATQLAHEWYMSRCIDDYAEMFLYAAEKYPHSYARAVTFLDQLQTLGSEKIRENILDRLEEEKLVNADREVVIGELERSYQDLRSAQKQPVYIAEGGVTYKRTAKKIMPNDPCPCGSGKKFKKCHGRK